MADFRATEIIPSTSLEEQGSDGPVHMALAPDGRVFVAKMRSGQIVMHTPPSTNTTIGTIPTWFRNESGLLGIAVPPNFATNNWLYAYTAGTSSTNRTRELVRYTVSGNSLTSRKVILTFSTFNNNGDPYHAGGGMAFTANGVLVIGVGDDTDPHAGNCTHGGWAAVQPNSQDCDAQKSAANTNDLRGGIIRLKPIEFSDTQTPSPGVGTTYSIPPGNLRDVIATLPNWGTQNISLVRPEVFAKGTRNAYKVNVDTRSGWIFWGEVGPDAGGNNTTTAGAGYAGQEEWNLATKAGYFGWPYSNGNSMYNGYNASSLTNTSSFNTGVQNLPPVTFPQVWYRSGGSAPGNKTEFATSGGHTAQTGPMYRYNASSTNANRFPPYYEGRVFFFEWSKRYIRTIQLTGSGTYTSSQEFRPTGLPAASYIDLQFGPPGSPNEGSMYVLWNSNNGYSGFGVAQLYRVDYTGNLNQTTTCFSPFAVTVQGPADATVSIQGGRNLRQVLPPALARGFVNMPAGYKGVEIYDVSGKMVWSHRRAQDLTSESMRLPAHLAPGVLQAKFLP